MQANEAQAAAVMHFQGPCLVLAGPGSGKTFTITKRILYLLERGVPPESILVITFTREAALSMQNRFRQMSGADKGREIIYPVNFGTFHSVFYHILKSSNALQSNQLLSNSEKKNLLLPILRSYKQERQQEEDQSSLNDDVAQILSAVSYYKNTMQLSGSRAKAPIRWQSCFEDIFHAYENAVKRTGRLDFDDMLYGCKKLLQENPDAQSYWQKRFSYILIDEFQDINPVQYEVVKLLAAEPYNIFAVGDDDQSIYGFRGSEPDCMKRFGSEYHARQLLLDINYRSKEEIVRASLAVIEENKNRFVKQLRAAAASDAMPAAMNGPAGSNTPDSLSLATPVTMHSFTGKEEQYGYMLKTLPVQLQSADCSCAVLFRTNSYMQGFAARLKAADIPYVMRERAASIYEHFIVIDIMTYLQVAQGEGAREQMLRIMNRPSRYISREAVGEGPIDIRKIQEYYERTQIPEKQKINILNSLKQFEKQLQSISRLSPLPAVSYILKAAGYEKYLKEISGSMTDKRQEWQEVLEWLKEDAARFKCYREWKDFQEEYTRSLGNNGEQKAALHSKDSGVKKNSVQLLTVHGAKGLEFDRVWIPDCNEKIFPHGAMPEQKAVEEERRIFYVAMTRAKKNLELLYITGTKERPRLPSRFLNPLYTQG